MSFKLKTSKRTEDIFREVGASEQLQPFILAKIALSLSIKCKGNLKEEDFFSDNNGRELSLQAITEEFDLLYKCLIEMREKRNMQDEEYFKYIKAHLDRGAVLLNNEHKYGGDFLVHLLEFENSI